MKTLTVILLVTVFSLLGVTSTLAYIVFQQETELSSIEMRISLLGLRSQNMEQELASVSSADQKLRRSVANIGSREGKIEDFIRLLIQAVEHGEDPSRYNSGSHQTKNYTDPVDLPGMF